MTIAHTVMFHWKKTTTAAQVEELAHALDGLPAVVKGLRSFHHGPDLGVRDGNCDYAVVLTLEDGQALADYFTNPEHVRIIHDLVAPLVDSKHAVQFEI
jgi:hypothetical protein